MPEKPDVIFPVEPWTITETEFLVKTNYRNETTFALSNGYIGTRGTHDECMDFDIDTGLEGNFINGFYESEDVRYGEWNFGFPQKSQSLLNLPNPKRIVPIIDGESLDLRVATISEYRRQLRLKDGVVTRALVWTTWTGKRLLIESERFCSLADKNLLVMRYAVTPLNFSGAIDICSSLDANVENHTRTTNPLVDYGPFGRRLDQEDLTSEGNRLLYRGVTMNTKLHMCCGIEHIFDTEEYEAQTAIEPMFAQTRFTIQGAKGVRVCLTKLIVMTSSLDINERELREFVTKRLSSAREKGYEALRYEHTRYVKRFWDAADVEIDADDSLQQGIRFNLFHIMQAAGRDGQTGMGAKGLTGEGYEGHYFWDTEIYVLPVFIYTQPELARNLLLYRYNTLDKARKRARELGHPCGALYPWRTINGEEASTYFPLGTAQYHINGDIANAVWQYVEATNDMAFLLEYGVEMLCEISRVWADVGCFSDARAGKYCICSVTGPDEYNAIVDNNFYTNLLAQENLRQTLNALETAEEYDRAKALALTKRLGVTARERASWKRVADNMYFPYDAKLGVYAQDDGFMMRKPWDDSRIAPEKRHLLYENFHPLFIYRQRMSKQADAILGLLLFSARFSDDELKRNYDFYQSVTLHHSSLSTSIFGMLACRVGYYEQAYLYFEESARMDLDDCHRNVYAGIHAANMAGTWLGIVMGFAGFRVNGTLIEFSPILPKQWNGYRFHMLWRGRRLLIDVNKSGALISLEDGDTLTILYRGQRRNLLKGELLRESI